MGERQKDWRRENDKENRSKEIALNHVSSTRKKALILLFFLSHTHAVIWCVLRVAVLKYSQGEVLF